MQIKKWLKSKKGNALLLSTAGAIAATFSVYFFVSLTTLSEEAKQRVTHLYNAYQMGQSILGKIDGSEGEEVRLGVKTFDEIHDIVSDDFASGNFITLQEMIDASVIIAANDPTATTRRGEDTGYMLDDSGVLITYVDSSGDEITSANSTTVVDNIHLFVNLAGTADSTSNSPYSAGKSFFYIVMDSDNAGSASLTVDTAVYTEGILSLQEGGPQAEQSVILPQDGE